MNALRSTAIALLASALLGVPAYAADTPEKSFAAPNDVKVSVKEIGPVTQTRDLQIICVIKHSNHDKYIEAMQDFNEKQGKLLSSIRSKGEFNGDLGETFLYTPPANSITPSRVLLIGIGDDKGISLDRLRLVGRIAAREAVRMQAKTVAFAPPLPAQQSTAVDVGDE